MRVVEEYRAFARPNRRRCEGRKKDGVYLRGGHRPRRQKIDKDRDSAFYSGFHRLRI
jgi:hypothetical protein